MNYLRNIALAVGLTVISGTALADGPYLLILGIHGGGTGGTSIATSQVNSLSACNAAGDAWVADSLTGFYSCVATDNATNPPAASTSTYKLIMTLGDSSIFSASFTSSGACDAAGTAWGDQMGTRQHSYVCVAE